MEYFYVILLGVNFRLFTKVINDMAGKIRDLTVRFCERSVWKLIYVIFGWTSLRCSLAEKKRENSKRVANAGVFKKCNKLQADNGKHKGMMGPKNFVRTICFIAHLRWIKILKKCNWLFMIEIAWCTVPLQVVQGLFLAKWHEPLKFCIFTNE